MSGGYQSQPAENGIRHPFRRFEQPAVGWQACLRSAASSFWIAKQHAREQGQGRRSRGRRCLDADLGCAPSLPIRNPTRHRICSAFSNHSVRYGDGTTPDFIHDITNLLFLHARIPRRKPSPRHFMIPFARSLLGGMKGRGDVAKRIQSHAGVNLMILGLQVHHRPSFDAFNEERSQ